MGKVFIQDYTYRHPYEMIGEEAGICYGTNTSDPVKNYKRGVQCVDDGHGRTLEFPEVYMVLDGYSARVIREFYTHIGGAPTRLQASTRYINYGDFDYIIPASLDTDVKKEIYEDLMFHIQDAFINLQNLGVPKEDIANILPLGMTTKVVVRTNARNLIDMSRNRMCTRAYWEFRELMNDIAEALKNYSPQWEKLVNENLVPKCEILGYCPEHHGCGKFPKKD